MLKWTMFIYQFFVVIFDFLHLISRSILLCLIGLLRVFYPKKLKSLGGETVLVTGAGHGIGRELSLQFARLGAKVVCLDIREKSNRETVSQISKEGGSAWSFWCDVSKRDEISTVSKKIRDIVGDVTIVVNNAGIMPCKPFFKHKSEEIEKLFRTNVFSQFWIIQEWLPTFLVNGAGHIVSLSSVCGVIGTPNLVPYCSTKFAIKGLMEGLTEELRYGGLYPNIKLTTVHPYHVDTGLARNKRIRFPSLNPVISTEMCADLIIAGVRKNDQVVFVPNKDFYFFKFFGMLPRGIQHGVLDFVDSGVDADLEPVKEF